MARSEAIKPGDRVKVNHLGRVFWATVTAKEGRTFAINPDNPRRNTWRTATARQILEVHPAWSPERTLIRQST